MKRSITRRHLYHIDFIRSRLSKYNLSSFRSTCFGKFIHLEEIQYHGGLMYLMLSSIDKRCLGERRLSYVINNSCLDLGPAEYYYLVGLSFKESGMPQHSSTIHEEIFKGKPNVTFCDIAKAFKQYTKEKAGTGKRVLQLSLLYLLYGVLLNRGSRSTKVDLRHVHLVDDIDAFNSYPWGRITYDSFVDCSQAAARSLQRSKNLNDVPEAHQYGLSFVLQVWALEVMPNLALGSAIPRRLLSRISPRILRWALLPYVNYIDFKSHFTTGDCASMHPIQPSDEEREMWETWGISRKECEILFSKQPLPKQRMEFKDDSTCGNYFESSEESSKDPSDRESPTLPAWIQIVTDSPDQAWKADGTKYLIKEIYGKVDEAIIRVSKMDHGLPDLSSKLDCLLHESASVDFGPCTPNPSRTGIEASKKRTPLIDANVLTRAAKSRKVQKKLPLFSVGCSNDGVLLLKDL